MDKIKSHPYVINLVCTLRRELIDIAIDKLTQAICDEWDANVLAESKA